MGWGPSAPQFWGCLSIYAHTLYHRTTKFDMVTHVVKVRVSWGQPLLPSQVEFHGSPILGFSCIYAYTL